GLVGLGGGLAAVQVRGESQEALGREALAHVGDVGHQAPPLLDDHEGHTGAGGRRGQVALGRAPVRSEPDDLSHGPRPYPARRTRAGARAVARCGRPDYPRASIAALMASTRRASSTWRFSIMRPSTVTTPRP